MSMKVKTILIVIGLLVAIAGFNYVINMDPTQLAARGVGQEHSHGDEEEEESPDGRPSEADLRQPLGEEGAPVVIHALVQDMGELEFPFRPIMSAIAQDYAGLVYIDFPTADSEGYDELLEQAKGSILGLVINGEIIKEVPEANLGFITFQGSPTFEDWNERDVRLAVEHELEEAGVEFTSKVEHSHPLIPPGAQGAHAGHSH
jgi:hypothetical protein